MRSRSLKLLLIFLSMGVLFSGPLFAQTQNFPTAVMGAGNATEVVFFAEDVTLSQATVFAAFLSTTGETVETQSGEIVPNGSCSFLFEGNSEIQVGHIDFVAPPGVFATQLIQLNVSGTNVPPVGVAPSLSCDDPGAILIRNDKFDTGMALSNTRSEEVNCNWSIFGGKEGIPLGTGTVILPPFGQNQSFPLNEVSAPNGLFNVQFQCDGPVHPFSLFQRKDDGAIFSNGVACLH